MRPSGSKWNVSVPPKRTTIPRRKDSASMRHAAFRWLPPRSTTVCPADRTVGNSFWKLRKNTSRLDSET